jgi:outer membrane protein assembly factor BamA
MSGLKLVILFFVVLGFTCDANSQADPNIYGRVVAVDTTLGKILKVNRILIIGNKVTRDRIILRELTLVQGDTISAKNLANVLLRDKNKIYNLRLFNTVTIRILELAPDQIDLLVEVTERWYTFPVPIFELSDRNFNEWWQNYDHEFNRVNYGLRLYQYNFRGRNETLRLTAQFGFTRRFDLSYRIPNLDRNQKHGLILNLEYAEPKNLAYFTKDHKLLFLESDKTLRTMHVASLIYTYRKSFYETHSFGLEYRSSKVADTIAALNPNYYQGATTNQRFEAVSYTFSSDHRDVAAYSLKGYHFTTHLSKIGLGISSDVNQLLMNVSHAQYMDLKNGFYLSNFSSAFLSSPNTQPYTLFGALGYRKQFLRGYEVYVIEGPKFFLNKTTLKKRIFSRAWDFADVPFEQFQHFPLSIYIKGYLDLGYVENYPHYTEMDINNRLSNKFLSGAGAGIDIVTLYDAVLRFEYTFTGDGTRGFFFHVKKEF